MTTRVGIDSGGTFTDAVSLSNDGTIGVAKVPSTPDDPAQATIEAFGRVTTSPAGVELRHGTTVPTNTLLERRGARTALITNEGFRDILEIGRQRRPDLYDSQADRTRPLIPRNLRFEVQGRVSAAGEELQALELGDLRERLEEAQPEATAIALLHAYANDAQERALREELDAFPFVVASSSVAREFREYERTSTAVLNAYLSPGTTRYLERLATAPELPEDLLVMRSSGGLGAIADLAARPADALLSGPAAGAIAAAAVAKEAGFETAVGFDMGGTSTDVVLIRDARPELRLLTEIDGLPCRSPALAIHTVGAGGGSLASFDSGGALRVGPESAGAEPGPVAYGRGGTQPTVTDANVVLARVQQLVGGDISLDHGSAAQAVNALGNGAAGAILDVVEANMERALREVTVQRGVDPADAAIVAFGGAGALHAANLCRNIGARCVIVPPLSGLLSAVGLLAAPIRADRARTEIHPAKEYRPESLESLEKAAAESISWAGRPSVSRIVDCRYRGQSHEIPIELSARESAEDLARRFHAAHEERNGYRREHASIEVVTLRAVAEVASEVGVPEMLRTVHPKQRAGMQVGESKRGEILLSEDAASIWVPADFRVHLDAHHNLILEPL